MHATGGAGAGVEPLQCPGPLGLGPWVSCATHAMISDLALSCSMRWPACVLLPHRGQPPARRLHGSKCSGGESHGEEQNGQDDPCSSDGLGHLGREVDEEALPTPFFFLKTLLGSASFL